MSKLLRNLTSRGLSFAHLAKVPARAASDEPDTDDENKGKKGRRAEGDDDEPNDQDRDNGDSKRGRAEGDDDDADLDKDDGAGGKKGKRADSDEPDDDDSDPDAEDDDDDEEEMRGKSSAASVRRRERMRCATIMGSKYAARNPVLAANLAFNTTMTRQQAIGVLRDTPAAERAAPAARRNPNLGAGGERSMGSQQAVAASWEHAMAKAQGRR